MAENAKNSKSSGSSGSSANDSYNKGIQKKIDANNKIIEQIRKEDELRAQIAEREKQSLEYQKQKLNLQNSLREAMAGGNLLAAAEARQNLQALDRQRQLELEGDKKKDASAKRIAALEAENARLEKLKKSTSTDTSGVSGASGGSIVPVPKLTDFQKNIDDFTKFLKITNADFQSILGDETIGQRISAIFNKYVAMKPEDQKVIQDAYNSINTSGMNARDKALAWEQSMDAVAIAGLDGKTSAKEVKKDLNTIRKYTSDEKGGMLWSIQHAKTNFNGVPDISADMLYDITQGKTKLSDVPGEAVKILKAIKNGKVKLKDLPTDADTIATLVNAAKSKGVTIPKDIQALANEVTRAKGAAVMPKSKKGESLADKVKGLFNSVLNIPKNVLSGLGNAFKNWAASLLHADGGLIGYANGGKVRYFGPGGNVSGPGGPRDDLIPAMLSNGEYVIRASSVSKYGVNMLNSINAGRYNVPNGTKTASHSMATNNAINATFNISGPNADQVADQAIKKLELLMKKNGAVTRV